MVQIKNLISNGTSYSNFYFSEIKRSFKAENFPSQHFILSVNIFFLFLGTNCQQYRLRRCLHEK